MAAKHPFLLMLPFRSTGTSDAEPQPDRFQLPRLHGLLNEGAVAVRFNTAHHDGRLAQPFVGRLLIIRAQMHQAQMHRSQARPWIAILASYAIAIGALLPGSGFLAINPADALTVVCQGAHGVDDGRQNAPQGQLPCPYCVLMHGAPALLRPDRPLIGPVRRPAAIMVPAGSNPVAVRVGFASQYPRGPPKTKDEG